MPKRRKRRKKRRDEEMIQPKSPAEMRDLLEMNAALKRPLSPDAMLHLQKTYGNAYTQQVIQRKKGDEKKETQEISNEASEKTAYTTAYEQEVDAKISKQGELQMNLVRAIHMERYSKASWAYRHNIDRWQGMGHVELEQEKFEDDRIQVEKDGRFNMKLGPDFLDQLSRSANPDSREGRAILDFNREFNVKLKATLHYRSHDGRLQDNDVDYVDKLLGRNKNKQGFFLKLEIESVYWIRVDGKPEEKHLCGQIILQGIVADS